MPDQPRAWIAATLFICLVTKNVPSLSESLPQERLPESDTTIVALSISAVSALGSDGHRLLSDRYSEPLGKKVIDLDER